jgi:CHASE2 domain-containing sensor protein
VLLLSMLAAPQIYVHFDVAQHWRVLMFQWLVELSPRPLLPRNTKVVLIDDEDYWLGQAGGRRPIRRDYLAKLVRALDAADASVIALDFDVRLPDPEGRQIPKEYKSETDELISSIVSAAERHKIVLSKTIWFDASGNYRLDQDIYQPYGICSRLEHNRWTNSSTAAVRISPQAAENITCGYIALFSDQLVLPGRIEIGSGADTYLDSFSLAVARAYNPEIAAQLGGDLRYGSYISPKTLEAFHVIYSARQLLSLGPAAASPFRGHPVIVGADWCRFALHRCPGVDVHATPVGLMTGALLHANYTEAILDSRTLGLARAWVPEVLEGIFGVIAALVFAVCVKVTAKVAALLVLFAGLLLAQLLSIHFIGVFFEAVIPLIGLAVHSMLDQIFD